VDIHIELADIKADDWLNTQVTGEFLATIKDRVEAARCLQRERFRKEKIFFNSQISHRQLHTHCALSDEAKSLLKAAIKHFNFSARAYDKILRVSCTIADLDGSDKIKPEYISEAIQYRSLDRNPQV
jgi:magnesium chelatase family protein